jgi:hypothetical protein
MASDHRTYGQGFWFFFKWLLIGGGILFFGGLAVRTFPWMQGVTAPIEWGAFLPALFLFSLGGGVVVGLLGLACWLASPRGVGWSLAVVVLALVLFVLFVWPTPYRYFRDEHLQFVVRVNRITGDICYEGITPSSPALALFTSSAPCTPPPR